MRGDISERLHRADANPVVTMPSAQGHQPVENRDAGGIVLAPGELDHGPRQLAVRHPDQHGAVLVVLSRLRQRHFHMAQPAGQRLCEDLALPCFAGMLDLGEQRGELLGAGDHLAQRQPVKHGGGQRERLPER